MKKIYLLLVVIFSLSIAQLSAQAPGWQWAVNHGGSLDDYSESIVADNLGNIYVCGYFQSSSITFGVNILSNVNAGTSDMFIAKFNAAGEIVWAHSAGGTDDEEALSIDIDTAGNIWVTGYYISSSLIFGLFTLNNEGSFTSDIFVVKYDPDGNVLFATTAGNNNDDEPSSISASGTGNIFVNGAFSSPTITFGLETLTNIGIGSDMFFVIYDLDGNIISAKSAGGANSDRARCGAADDNGNYYIAGFFESPTITFGLITLFNIGAGSDMFVVKYNSSGEEIWAYSTGDAGKLDARSLALDFLGNCFVTGTFDSPSILFDITTLTNAGTGEDDMYIVKFNGEGELLWAKGFGGSKDDPARSVFTHQGDAYVAGYYKSDNILFDAEVVTNSSFDEDDFYLVKFSGSGDVEWVKGAGGPESDRCHAITIDDGGTITVSGYFSSSVLTLDAEALVNNEAGFYDLFVARLENNTAINEADEINNALLIYPNPAGSNLNISIIGNHELAEVNIIDISGKIIYSATVIGEETITIDTRNFAEGIYMVVAKTDGIIGMEKLVVIR